ncbi:MAG TPA: carbamoyltransferase C-terminal domain-containing protein [Acidimicrobiales bacterium]
MAAILGINAVFHDPAAALVVDGEIVAAAEEERFSRRKHGKEPVPFSTWELPVAAARWCLASANLTPADLDAVAYSYDPSLAPPPTGRDITADGWEALRTRFVERAPQFLQSALPGLVPTRVHFVPHHLAHAASAATASPHDGAAFLVLDGRGERGSYLAGRETARGLEVLAHQALPHSLGLVYEELTAHLGYRRSSDEYKVMALASYGEPRHLARFRELIRVGDDGGFRTDPVPWTELAPPGHGDDTLDPRHADLAASVQRRLEEVVFQLACWLHRRTAADVLTLAGGVALNCVANSYLYEHGPFGDVWVQPAAGDAGTSLGAALAVARRFDEPTKPMTTAALGRAFTDDQIEAALHAARIPHERPPDLADAVAQALAEDRVVAWFQGRAEFGPRALGQRSLLAHPGRRENLERLNDIKGREQFRPLAPMVLLERAREIFSGGPIPSPYMLFTHRVAPAWRDRIPAVVHVDGTARIQTVDATEQPLVHRCIRAFEHRTGLPVVINTSLNTAGRPMVDSPRDVLECFGSAPIDVLAIGPFVVRRPV